MIPERRARALRLRADEAVALVNACRDAIVAETRAEAGLAPGDPDPVFTTDQLQAINGGAMNLSIVASNLDVAAALRADDEEAEFDEDDEDTDESESDEGEMLGDPDAPLTNP